tara:strand:+ start:410 stop:883 length:474 start_codon:yes stop_codon:yes gene_type:complete
MFYNLSNKHNQLAVVEDLDVNVRQYNYINEHMHLYPKYNNLLWTWIDTIDYNTRYGLNYCDTYKYKDESPGIAFMKEWEDILKISKSRDEWYDGQFDDTNIRLEFIKSIYYIDKIPFVVINKSFKNFLIKVKKYYKNKISLKKHPTTLLKRQIYGHF